MVVRIDGDKVRIGIDAPKSVHIVREEIIDANRAALVCTCRRPTHPDPRPVHEAR